MAACCGGAATQSASPTLVAPSPSRVHRVLRVQPPSRLASDRERRDERDPRDAGIRGETARAAVPWRVGGAWPFPGRLVLHPQTIPATGYVAEGTVRWTTPASVIGTHSRSPRRDSSLRPLPRCADSPLAAACRSPNPTARTRSGSTSSPSKEAGAPRRSRTAGRDGLRTGRSDRGSESRRHSRFPRTKGRQRGRTGCRSAGSESHIDACTRSGVLLHTGRAHVRDAAHHFAIEPRRFSTRSPIDTT